MAGWDIGCQGNDLFHFGSIAKPVVFLARTVDLSLLETRLSVKGILVEFFHFPPTHLLNLGNRFPWGSA